MEMERKRLMPEERVTGGLLSVEGRGEGEMKDGSQVPTLDN